MLETGSTHTSRTTVDGTNTATALGSGSLDVFATPAMSALMENAAMLAVHSVMPKGSTTVGTALNITHTRATPLGAEISATAVLVAINGRELTFHVTAADSHGEIGAGTHTRFVVDVQRFMDKVLK